MAKRKKNRIGAEPLISRDSAPQIRNYNSPGIHTRYDALGGYSDLPRIIEIPSSFKNNKSGSVKKGDNSHMKLVNLSDVIKALKRYKKSRNISEMPPIQQVYDILCRNKGQCGAKTTDAINWLGEASRDGRGYYFALLDVFTSDEVLGEITDWETQIKEEMKTQRKDGQGGDGEAEDKEQTTPDITRVKAEPTCDQVFISYSHKDKRWLDDLRIHLKPHVRNGSITAWSDKQIVTGSKWFSEIKVALAATKVAVLLVTPHFLASDFIHEHELTPLLKGAKKGDVRIIWVPVRACSYKETTLKDYQAAIDPDKPLANMKAERDKAWVRICEEIKRAAVS